MSSVRTTIGRLTIRRIRNNWKKIQLNYQCDFSGKGGSDKKTGSKKFNDEKINNRNSSDNKKSFADKKAERLERKNNKKEEAWHKEVDKNKDETVDKVFAQMGWEKEVEKVKELRAKAKIEYENKVKTITALREQEKNDRINQLNEENEKTIKQAEDKKNADLLICNKKIDEYKQKLQDNETQLAKTFFLNAGKKKELGEISVHIQHKLIELNEEERNIKKKYDDYLIEIRNNTKKMIADIEKEVEKEYHIPSYLYEVELKYPLPESPADIERRKKVVDEMAEEERIAEEIRNKVKQESVYDKYKEKVRNLLANGPMTPADISNALGVYNVDMVNSIAFEMPDVKKAVVGKRIVYMLDNKRK